LVTPSQICLTVPPKCLVLNKAGGGFLVSIKNVHIGDFLVRSLRVEPSGLNLQAAHEARRASLLVTRAAVLDNFSRVITFLHGKLIEVLPTQVVVDVAGVGYEVLIPLSSFDKLPGIGQELRILTHLQVREDAHVLYGFMSAGERDLFRLLINTVSGIGPKIALNVLSGMSVTSFRGAVANSDVKSLSQISGVGKKTAERIVVELKDKVGKSGAWEAASAARALSPEDQKINDAVLALMALGFKQVEAHETIKAAADKLGPQAGVEDLVRAGLKKG
jgi:Holliday junction DNA helicase RuvA